MNDSVSYSWFAVFNNPHLHGYPFQGREDPAELLKRDANSFKSQVRELLEKLKNEWIGENKPSTTRTGAWSYCITADGLHHVHMVLEDGIAMRWSKIKSSYYHGMHFAPTKGTKVQADDYINKRGEFAEKGEQVIDIIYHGEIHSNQGHRSDLDQIQALLDGGKHPMEIITMSIKYARLEKHIWTYYNNKKADSVPPEREVNVHWLYGGTGTGKSHTYIDLLDKYGKYEVCRITDYSDPKHLFDAYNSEKVIFFDEFRGINYSRLLNYIDGFMINDLPARYKGKKSCYTEVYISTPLLPQEVYEYNYKQAKYDTIDQLMRRISDITYHYKDSEGNYCRKKIDVVGTEVHHRHEFLPSNSKVNNLMQRVKDNNIPIEYM